MSSFASPYEPALKRMLKLVNSLMARADCGPFLEPVDWRGLELYDYPKIIKKMMDLGTIKRKLERKSYKTAHECALDIRLVWKNCMTYNMEGSDFWLLAKNFSKRFEDRYKKIRAEYDTGEDLAERSAEEAAAAHANDSKSVSFSDNNNKQKSSSGFPTLDIKVQLASNLLLLTGMELGHVIQKIELNCPKALEDLGGERAEINIDAIDTKTLAELDVYTKEKVTFRYGEQVATGRPSKKRRK